MLKRIYAVLVFVAVLAGCSAALVPETSDPWKKYWQAVELFKDGRPVPAERLLRESMEGLASTDQFVHLAVVQLEYGEFIASPTFQQSRIFSSRVAELGGSEGLPARINEFNAKAESNLQKGLSSQAVAASPAERTQVLLLLLEAQARLKKNNEACGTVNQAAESYKAARGMSYEYRIHAPKGTVTEHLKQRNVLLSCGAT
ncbi:hypothetical protein LNV08_15560 [Paucibacter sp. TC2R-5]|uniref:hypothetical protein n=1 Tax=Paucibacter sp. TC2R-5 TaxID=2893555 RepID=UPI0021E485F9|nr:hypothetical protein [Paucibacter sp. TC2R-5]MCV2360393.1 hypothetical protein [Paucibacter sp. TC2R-5]